ncbi:(alpha)-aspartyl dipeptidase E (Peptidase S51 family) [Cupriavidus taiwanensis]|uniref:dipeptidase E n=1 Tax=Cupriavidus taiwanensis TaxID=164546 RepID=A0A375EBS0_9BURK|nr:dipeptidase PepE [Cupriavidus taiwanensis]SOZ68051.1 (alpha)-aspartyl dipeptidase E (Peptidase S51 family) [Cupriavidus taiwanensis]SOZ68960.1 (alpha)-aspartyl dipeptidase E (Peptidase S51 family) [Cupriavidus taiwanensis]SOZ72603.1 (alpha)-aspartyl dipeptidase E (Peptidase S51 family) [Cupriavidus taiwanensis]SPA09601.1 (alpha)-aspartyl dipeptidase E (Peptidase S51 family) [Cupriavidus taiwanensis]
MTQRILLMSSSRKDNLGYLEHAGEQIHTLLKHEPRKVLFVPFAGVTFSFDTYEGMVRPVFEKLGYALESIHHSADPLRAVQQAEAIAVGGGNTFALLKRLYDAGIVDAIRAKVRAGTPYVAWSAGSNVACPTIRTTNDMPIVQPPSLRALGLVPFQINPHFISGKPAGHNGESREERLAEFLHINAPERVFALPEGSALYADGTTGTVLGERNALWFSAEGKVETLREGEPFLLSQITGPAGMEDWPGFAA